MSAPLTQTMTTAAGSNFASQQVNTYLTRCVHISEFVGVLNFSLRTKTSTDFENFSISSIYRKGERQLSSVLK